jgi:hypothetical protein
MDPVSRRNVLAAAAAATNPLEADDLAFNVLATPGGAAA